MTISDMEIKILITRDNKKRVLSLISDLVDSETEAVQNTDPNGDTSTQHSTSVTELKTINGEGINFMPSKIRPSPLGTWCMFNSYLPGKCALRILTKMLQENGGKEILFNEFVDRCAEAFKHSHLSEFRGFPKNSKESAVARLAWHLIQPFADMGLMRIEGEPKRISITKEGFELASIPNPFLDENEKNLILSSAERQWIKEHLRRITKSGYEEMTILSSLREFLIQRKGVKFSDLAGWFLKNQIFLRSIKSQSRYKDDPRRLEKQIENLARAYASGKIALLRELGVVSDKRNTYTVIGELR